MKISRFIVLLAVVSLPVGSVSFAQAPAPAQGFDVYRVLGERNIFDPNRLPMVQGAPPRVVEQPHKATDYVMLTGVMVDNGKALAFFSGSRPDYDKVTDVNGEIAGAKLKRIEPGGIEVDRAGKRIVVAVGQTVPFDDSAPGAPPAAGLASTAPAPSTTGTGDASPATPQLPGNLNEVMRRMMERRQHELQ